MIYRGLLKLINFFCFIISILIFFLSLNRWNECLGSIVTITVAVFGFFIFCQFNYSRLKYFAIASTIDLVIIIINAILLTILTVKWDKFCKGETIIDDDDDSDLNCYNLREYGYRVRMISTLTIFYIALLFRIATASISLALANYYQNEYKKRLKINFTYH